MNTPEPVMDQREDLHAAQKQQKPLPPDDPRVVAFQACDAILSRSPLGAAGQAAVATMVLAAAAARVNIAHPNVGRGKIINSLTDDVRRTMQREIPL